MSVTVNWVDSEDKKILHFEYRDNWTWEESFEQIQESQQMMDTVSQKVATIIDLTDNNKIPTGAMDAIGKIFSFPIHPNDSTVIVFLNAEALTKAMLDFISIANPDKVNFREFIHAKTLDEAIDKVMDLLNNSS
jgi:hypothetical protein